MFPTLKERSPFSSESWLIFRSIWPFSVFRSWHCFRASCRRASRLQERRALGAGRRKQHPISSQKLPGTQSLSQSCSLFWRATFGAACPFFPHKELAADAHEWPGGAARNALSPAPCMTQTPRGIYLSFFSLSSSISLGSSWSAACLSLSRVRRSMRCCITVICASARGGHVTNLLLQGSVLPPPQLSESWSEAGEAGLAAPGAFGCPGCAAGDEKGKEERAAPMRTGGNPQRGERLSRGWEGLSLAGCSQPLGSRTRSSLQACSELF